MTKGYLTVGGPVQNTILATIASATMNYQNTHAWIARGGETSDKTFAPAPHFLEHKELTAEEDKAEKRVQIKVGFLRILGQKKLGLLRIPLAGGSTEVGYCAQNQPNFNFLFGAILISLGISSPLQLSDYFTLKLRSVESDF